MIYAMSDIHGMYDKYVEMLKCINFTDSDTLYILGDVIDRGEKPIEVLQDMRSRVNVIPIIGNHECLAIAILENILHSPAQESDNLPEYREMLQAAQLWGLNGGLATFKGFTFLSQEERLEIFNYLLEFSVYEQIAIGCQKFVLSHCGVPDGATFDNLDSFPLDEFLEAELDYDRIYFADAFLVTGHNPTLTIDKEYRGKIYRKNNHIAIDTGAVYGEALACICLNTGEEFYV
jgi:serine/threonine protein phosphatase 1